MRARVRGGGLTQWGSSWRRERVCGRGGPGKNHRDAKTADSRELWKSVEKQKPHLSREATGEKPARRSPTGDWGLFYPNVNLISATCFPSRQSFAIISSICFR
jgi:hypothetical protein